MKKIPETGRKFCLRTEFSEFHRIQAGSRREDNFSALSQGRTKDEQVSVWQGAYPPLGYSDTFLPSGPIPTLRFQCLQCQWHEGKLDKEKGSCLSQEDFGTRSGETVSKAAQSPAGRPRSVCLAVFCYQSEANSPSLRAAVPGTPWLPRS